MQVNLKAVYLKYINQGTFYKATLNIRRKLKMLQQYQVEGPIWQNIKPCKLLLF